MTDEEQYCIDTIAILRNEFDKAAKPYLEKLAQIRAARVPSFYLSAEQFDNLFCTQRKEEK